MEQQIISITKCGVRVNLPSSVVVIAAANPKGSFYDRTKTLAGNVRITAPLLSRFDLIYTLGEQDKSSDAAFIKHVSKKPKMMGNDSKSFFGPQQVVNKDKISWLKLQPGEELDIMPSHFLQLYIGFARENIHPTLSQEAKDEIRRFFLKLRELTIGFDAQTVTYRQIEALVRLTLARARADLAEVATKEHAIDIINLSKFTMTDIFEDESLLDSSEHGSFRKSKTPNCSSLSKPKQLKAFIEHLRDLEQEEYTTSHLKEIAKELGIRDIYEIVDKLNHAGELLKTADGYKVVN